MVDEANNMDPLGPGKKGDTPDGFGRKVTERLLQKGYHPVLMFGASQSGKTTLLVSLLSYASRNVNTRLGDWIVPADTELGRLVDSEAQRLFNHVVFEFNEGKKPSQTMADFPIFIPIVLKPKGLPEVKLVFLESMGGWFEPDFQTDALYKPLRQDVVDILKHFTKGISVLHIAPYTTTDEPPPYTTTDEIPPYRNGIISRQKIVDLTLRGCIKSYEDQRTSPHKDEHLYLLSKWDVCAQPHKKDSIFSNPSPEDIISIIRERFGYSWPAYQNLNVYLNSGRQAYMQYSAGRMDNEVLAISEDMKPVFDRYNRTILNWLYQNATTNTNAGVTLFPDVLPPPPPLPPKQTKADKLLDFFGVKQIRNRS